MKCVNILCKEEIEKDGLTGGYNCTCGLNYSAVDILNLENTKYIKDRLEQLLKDIGPATGGQSHYDWILEHGKEINTLKDNFRSLISITQNYFKFELKWFQNGIGNEATDQVRSLCNDISTLSHKLWQIEKGNIKIKRFELDSFRTKKAFAIKSLEGYHSADHPLQEVISFIKENMEIGKDYNISIKIEIKKEDNPENKGVE